MDTDTKIDSVGRLRDAIENVNECIGTEAEYSFLEPATEYQRNINNPVLFGIFLMGWLGNDPDHFTGEEKAYWLKVAETLGPDWIGKFRRIGKWMAEAANA